MVGDALQGSGKHVPDRTPTAAPEGLRRTEAGQTPDGWRATTIGEFAPLQRGFDLPASRVRPGDYPVVYSNGILRTHKHAMVRGPGVITGRSGTIGKVHYVEADYWPHNTALWVTSFRDNDPRFAYYLYTHVGFERFQSGSGVPTLNRNDVHQHRVLVPPPSEQRAIAKALSDVDELLQTLDALITKKQAIKQATMQQLLTGRTRLPGFSGPWATKRLGELGATYGGLTGKGKADFGNGDARYVTFLNVLNNVVLDSDGLDRVRVAATESQNRVRIGDLLFNGTSETPGDLAMGAVVGIDEPDLYLNSFCFGFRIRDQAECSPLFLAYYFRGAPGRQLMYALAQGATRYNMSKDQFLALALPLPCAHEQSAISTVLSDMDAEIDALERLRDKTRAIKLGMMQQLLTGRIRLPELTTEMEASA